jgi:prolyl-tRNA synthetase
VQLQGLVLAASIAAAAAARGGGEQEELPEGTLCFASGKPAKNWALWGRSY